MIFPDVTFTVVVVTVLSVVIAALIHAVHRRGLRHR